jgi:hypothetical protein
VILRWLNGEILHSLNNRIAVLGLFFSAESHGKYDRFAMRLCG